MLNQVNSISASLENYLEAVYLLSKETEQAVRVKDIADFLSVSSPSVVYAIRELTEYNLVTHNHYGGVSLSPLGLKYSLLIYERHETLYRFFTQVLGVPPEAAEREACAIEHALSQDTWQRMRSFLNRHIYI